MESQVKFGSPRKDGIVRVGSRKSQLALIQTNLVINKLREFHSNNSDKLGKVKPNSKDGFETDIEFEVVAMSTTGDQILDKPLPDIGTKSLFTRELEIALLEKSVDLVVHSLKDLPTTLPTGCVIGAILKRDNPNDVIVLKDSLRTKVDPVTLLLGNQNIGNSLKIGTSSHRRIAMIKHLNDSIECIDIRGNLNTRIMKLDKDESEYSAIILAKAGLDRMGLSERASEDLAPQSNLRLTNWSYAVGQGAIAVECRADDDFILELLNPIVNLQTTLEIIAERSLMKKLEGGCSVPLGVRSTWKCQGNAKILNLESVVLSLDGKNVVKAAGKVELVSDENYKGGDAEVTQKSELTGIVLAKSLSTSMTILHDLDRCSQLGIEVANKMIDLGCIELMNRQN